jgi:hypothetical protein
MSRAASSGFKKGRKQMARWQFPVLPADLVEQDPTQRDQFNNDEVGLAGALVREVIQNSTDAPFGNGPVKVRFSRRPMNIEETTSLKAMFETLVPHLEACSHPKDALSQPVADILAIEDFNTRGLTGSVNTLDEDNFRNFWRRHGKSGKDGNRGGRWGLGKLVYSSSSRLSCFFGLTRRAGDERALLMGQAVLATHEFDGRRRPAHGFWFCDKSSNDLQLPLTDTKEVEKLSKLAGFKRTNETGLSIAIPYPASSITEAALIQGVLENYYFPILAGQLVVEVGDTLIDQHTFLSIAGATKLNVPFGFVAEVSQRFESKPDVESSVPVTATGVTEEHILSQLTQLREKLSEGHLVHVRLPVEVRARTGVDAGTTQMATFDVFLQNPGIPGDSFSLFVRGALTVPGERRYFSNVAAYGAMVARDGPIASLLGDAENPAHTGWNASAEKLTKRWDRGDIAVKAVRHAPRQLQQLLGGQVEQKDPDALIDFFSLIDENAEPKARKKRKSVKPIILAPQKPKSLVIRGRNGGFTLVAGPGAQAWAYPCQVRIRCAYDIIGSDPFKRWSPFDFTLDKDELTIELKDAETTSRKGNVFRLTLKSPNFELDASGFDVNRDLLVEARSV